MELPYKRHVVWLRSTERLNNLFNKIVYLYDLQSLRKHDKKVNLD
jgi:hypothetical protein